MATEPRYSVVPFKRDLRRVIYAIWDRDLRAYVDSSWKRPAMVIRADALNADWEERA